MSERGMLAIIIGGVILATCLGIAEIVKAHKGPGVRRCVACNKEEPPGRVYVCPGCRTKLEEKP